MAFNPAPTALWPSYTSDGINITIPIASLPGLTAGEAHTTTGDWREILLSIVSSSYTYYTGLITADRPQAVVARVPSVTPITSGVLAYTFKTTYQFEFYNEYATPDVANEPI
jgi:hypothetical protein